MVKVKASKNPCNVLISSSQAGMRIGFSVQITAQSPFKLRNEWAFLFFIYFFLIQTQAAVRGTAENSTSLFSNQSSE